MPMLCLRLHPSTPHLLNQQPRYPCPPSRTCSRHSMQPIKRCKFPCDCPHGHHAGRGISHVLLTQRYHGHCGCPQRCRVLQGCTFLSSCVAHFPSCLIGLRGSCGLPVRLSGKKPFRVISSTALSRALAALTPLGAVAPDVCTTPGPSVLLLRSHPLCHATPGARTRHCISG